MIRIVVYDDNRLRRDSLETLLSFTSELEYIAGFENCNNVVKETTALQPDLILMDIEMPGTDGITGVRLVKQQFPHIKIIIQTAFDDDDKVFAALQAGAEGYILKNASVHQITQSIDDVMAGGAGMSPSIALKVMRYFNKPATESANTLTPKENETMKLLAQGLSYKMVADAMGISYFTVNNHVKKIYEKLQVHSMGEALAFARKQRLL
ncbi:MAG: response regulator transcription factor [Bacteroidota bacterium]